VHTVSYLNSDAIRWIGRLSLIAAIQIVSPSAVAQPQARLHAEEGPHFIGVPVRLQVIVEGFEETPQPEIQAPNPAQGRLELVGISPSVSTSIRIINGRMSRSEQVHFTFEYQFFARTPGERIIGPFRVLQNDIQASTGQLRLTIGKVPVSRHQRLRLILPAGSLILGQQVTARIEWWLPAELSGALFNPRLTVPLFDRLDAFRFYDTRDPAADIALTLETPSGPVELAATTRRESWRGKPYLVHTLTCRLTPLRSGEFELAPAGLIVDQAIHWRRNLFGERVPTHVQKRRVEDEPRTLIVQELPQAGRPESFTGTVGSGYRLEVTADRSVVRVGDPIRLTLTLRGDAAVETSVLPPLTADGGLSPQDFRIPGNKTAGIHADGAKRFQVTVRALHPRVTAIPPLAFSWYDPRNQEYRTTRSRPVALAVHPARVVSAKDVVSAKPAEPQTRATDSEQGPTAEPRTTTESGSHPAFGLTGADLAITTDLDALRQPSGSPLTGTGARIAPYALGLLAMLLAIPARRHVQADPARLARTQALRTQRAAIAEARTPAAASTTLRQMVATTGTPPPPELDRFLAECDAAAYAPDSASRTLDGPMQARAAQLADRILKEADQ